MAMTYDDWKLMCQPDEDEDDNKGEYPSHDEDAELRADAVQVNNVLAAYTQRWYGERCPDYDPDCALCKAWHIVDLFEELNIYSTED